MDRMFGHQLIVKHCMAGRGHKRMTSLYVYIILKVNILYDNVAVERLKRHKEGL